MGHLNCGIVYWEGDDVKCNLTGDIQSFLSHLFIRNKI